MSNKGIVFGKGFLGTRIAEELGYELFGREVDISDNKSLSKFIDENKPDVVINAIAKTGTPNVDWCEFNKEETLLSNVLIPSNLGVISKERGIYFVHLSSGCIYEGDNGGNGFREIDRPNYYGKQFYATSKILAEKALEGVPYLILRPRMPIDDRPHPRNLITKLSKYFQVIEEPNSMTTVPDLIEVMKKLIDKRAFGIYNVVNPGTTNAAQIMDLYKEMVDPTHKFERISLDKLWTLTKTGRSNCILNTEKLSVEGISMPPIEEAVKQCLKNYKKNTK